MKFRFCGDADCPDWVLAEINTLSRLSSVKIKALANLVAKSLISPPFNVVKMEKATQLFVDSKLDCDIDLKACVACLTYILTSAIRFNCDSNALQSELQQLGLPREHSTAIKRVTDEQAQELKEKFRKDSLKVNRLEKVEAQWDDKVDGAELKVRFNDQEEILTIARPTLDDLINNLKTARETMSKLVL